MHGWRDNNIDLSGNIIASDKRVPWQPVGELNPSFQVENLTS